MNEPNHLTNKKFFEITDAVTKNEVLGAIARHYGITKEKALEEVTAEGAEHLLDYLVGGIRTAAHLLMKRHRLTA